MLFNNRSDIQSDEQIKEEFKKLWNKELLKNVDRRDFSKAYNYALRKRSIKDWAMKNYFSFNSEKSARYKEACDAFDEGDMFWTFMLIYEFVSVPEYSAKLKHLTNKRHALLSDKRKESVISRQSVHYYMREVMQKNRDGCDEFIRSALRDMALYEKYKSQGKYLSAYKLAVLADKPENYTSNMKKYLYVAVRRPITKENEADTLKYIEYVGRYFNLKRKLYGGGYIYIKDIDVVTALIVFSRNGGNVNMQELKKDIHRTVKVYCRESVFSPIYTLADYLHQIEAHDMEKSVIELLLRYNEAIDEKYKKRYTTLNLFNEDPNKFIFRHDSRKTLECIIYNPIESFSDLIRKSTLEKENNSWCVAIQRKVRTFELDSKYYFDGLFSNLESILNNEFGDYILERIERIFFSGDEYHKGQHSMLIVTSGINKFVDFPNIGLMIKLEPISKKITNIHFCLLYLPEENYTDSMIENDSKYVASILNGKIGTRFETFYSKMENLVWSTVEKILDK